MYVWGGMGCDGMGWDGMGKSQEAPSLQSCAAYLSRCHHRSLSCRGECDGNNQMCGICGPPSSSPSSSSHVVRIKGRDERGLSGRMTVSGGPVSILDTCLRGSGRAVDGDVVLVAPVVHGLGVVDLPAHAADHLRRRPHCPLRFSKHRQISDVC